MAGGGRRRPRRPEPTCYESVSMAGADRRWVTLLEDVRAAVERAAAGRPPGGGHRSSNGAADAWIAPLAEPASLRRGQVWLAEAGRGGRQQPVLLIGRPGSSGATDIVITARIVRILAQGRDRVTLGEADGMPVPCSVDARRLETVPAASLVRLLAELAAERMAAVDEALLYALGLERQVAVPAPSLRPVVGQLSPLAADPGGAVSARADDEWPQPGASGRLEDHPMAQLFGLSQPPVAPSASVRHEPVMPAAPLAPLAPALHELAANAFGLSASRLDAVIDEAVEEGRSIEWLADAVRSTSIRGVLPSRIEAIAAEMLALGGQPAPR